MKNIINSISRQQRQLIHLFFNFIFDFKRFRKLKEHLFIQTFLIEVFN